MSSLVYRCCVIVLALSVPIGALAQTVITEILNPPFGVGARMAALAESDLAEARDASGMYWNPASLSGVERHSALASHQWTNNLSNEIGAIAFRLSGADVIALGGLMTQFPSYRIGSGSSRTPLQYGIDIAYAHTFTYSFSVGGRLSGRFGQLEGTGSSITAGYANFGIFYNPTPVFSYGAVYNQVGSGIVYRRDAAGVTFRQERLPGSVELGVAMRYPSTGRHRTLTMSISNEKIIDRNGMNYKFGIEYLPIPYAAVRLGYFVEPGKTRATYGAGLSLAGFMVDYAFVPHKYSVDLHQMTLTALF